jgi:hypothetical protein
VSLLSAAIVLAVGMVLSAVIVARAVRGESPLVLWRPSMKKVNRVFIVLLGVWVVFSVIICADGSGDLLTTVLLGSILLGALWLLVWVLQKALNWIAPRSRKTKP